MARRQTSKELDTELRDLVMQTRSGDESAYKTLLETLAPFIRRNCGSLLAQYSQTAQTEDVTQEVLLAVHLKLHTYDDARSFITWIRAVIKHKAIDMLRRQNVNFTSIDELGFEPVDQENPEITAVRGDLQKLLAQLKPPAGDIIYALKVEGATIKELADTHHMSESNIKVIIHRGLKKLSTLIMQNKTRRAT